MCRSRFWSTNATFLSPAISVWLRWSSYTSNVCSTVKFIGFPLLMSKNRIILLLTPSTIANMSLDMESFFLFRNSTIDLIYRLYYILFLAPWGWIQVYHHNYISLVHLRPQPNRKNLSSTLFDLHHLLNQIWRVYSNSWSCRYNNDY